jgi:pimeloyl-ACP methyl ester carboxylesterase
LTQLADDQAAFFDALGIEKVHILAYDWGSIVAHKFIRKYCNRVVRAAIIGPITPHFGPMKGTYTQDDWYALFGQHDLAVNLVSLNRNSRRLYYKHFYDVWSFRKPLLSDQELEIEIDNYMKAGNVHAGFNYDRANLASNSKPWTAEDYVVSDVPMTLLWGTADTGVPVAGSKHIPQFYSNYTLELIDQCGHFVMIEKPEIVIDRVLKSFT